jgi:hypothetical protein
MDGKLKDRHSLQGFSFFFQIPQVCPVARIPSIKLALNGNCPKWVVAFFQKFVAAIGDL